MGKDEEESKKAPQVWLIIGLSIIIVVSIGLVTAILIVLAVNPNRFCPDDQDYSPCICSSSKNLKGDDSWTITCNEIPMKNLKNIFSRNKGVDLSHLIITTTWSDRIVPADFLSNGHRAEIIQLIGPTDNSIPNPYASIKMDVNAFQSTADLTSKIIMEHFDLGSMDFDFLNEFYQLDTLQFKMSINLDTMNWTSLPDLRALTKLFIEESSGLDQISPGPVLVRGLTDFVLNQTKLSDEAANRILEWVLISSQDTLERLNMDYNDFTKIPDQIKSFKKLNSFTARGQMSAGGIDTISQDSLSLQTGVSEIILENCNVKTIEPQAFKGDYSKAIVGLNGNQLSRFEATVFQEILIQMNTTSDASISHVNVASNSFDCQTDPCHLAWLIRDNRNLLKFVEDAVCSNGVRFESLNPQAFSECPSSKRS